MTSKPDHKTIWIIGGTGLIGHQLVQILCAQGHHVVSLLRRPSGQASSRLSEFQIDFEELATQGAAALPTLPKPDSLISTLGTTQKTAGSKEAFYHIDHDYVLGFAKAGQASGAKHMMMVSSVSADRNSSSFYLRVKGEVESHIEALGFTRFDIFRPGLLLGQRSEHRFAEQLGAKIMPAIAPLLPSKYRAVHSKDVAQAVAQRLSQKEEGHHIFHNNDINSLARF